MKHQFKRIIPLGVLSIIFIILFTPVIPAVQVNAVENQYEDKFEELNFIDIDTMDGKKFPLLYLFVIVVNNYMVHRMNFWLDIWHDWQGNYPQFLHDIASLMWMIHATSAISWVHNWQAISNYFGWGWVLYSL